MKPPAPVKPGDPMDIAQLLELRAFVASLAPASSRGVGVLSMPGGTATAFESQPRFPALITSGPSSGLYAWKRRAKRGGAWVDVPGWVGQAEEINGAVLVPPFPAEVWLDMASRVWVFQSESCGV